MAPARAARHDPDRPPLRVHVAPARDRDVDGGVRAERVDHPRGEVGVPTVVGVEEGHELARGERERGVARRRGAGLGLTAHDHAPPLARPLARQRVEDVARSVSRAVVHGDELDPRMGLREGRAHGLGDVGGHVVRRHDDRDEGGARGIVRRAGGDGLGHGSGRDHGAGRGLTARRKLRSDRTAAGRAPRARAGVPAGLAARAAGLKRSYDCRSRLARSVAPFAGEPPARARVRGRAVAARESRRSLALARTRARFTRFGLQQRLGRAPPLALADPPAKLGRSDARSRRTRRSDWGRGVRSLSQAADFVVGGSGLCSARAAEIKGRP